MAGRALDCMRMHLYFMSREDWISLIAYLCFDSETCFMEEVHYGFLTQSVFAFKLS
jgi:hypothetical protein